MIVASFLTEDGQKQLVALTELAEQLSFSPRLIWKWLKLQVVEFASQIYQW